MRTHPGESWSLASFNLRQFRFWADEDVAARDLNRNDRNQIQTHDRRPGRVVQPKSAIASPVLSQMESVTAQMGTRAHRP